MSGNWNKSGGNSLKTSWIIKELMAMSFKGDTTRMNINIHTTLHQTHYLDGSHSTRHSRKVLHLQKLDKKRQLSQSLSWINRIKQRLWGRDGPNADQGPEVKKKQVTSKEEKKDQKCSTLPRNARLGKFQYKIGNVSRPKKNICLFKLSCQNKIGSVGRNFFYF